MENYNSIRDALDDLQRRGYQVNADLAGEHNLPPAQIDLNSTVTDFHIDEIHLFEGALIPEKAVILYAVTYSNEVRGIRVEECGFNLNPFP